MDNNNLLMNNNNNNRYDSLSPLDTIISNAKIDKIHQYSGSELNYDSPPLLKIRQNKGKDLDINAQDYVSPYSYKLLIRLDEEPVFFEEIKSLDPQVRVTRGFYCIRYNTKTDRNYRKGRPWQIGQDLIRMSIKVSGPTHWHYLCDRIPELKWIDRNSTFSDRLFDIAARHPNMTFWFGIDLPRYVDMLEQKAGGRIDTPFVAFKCSKEKYEKVYKNKQARIRAYGDVLKELNDVERLEDVQAEMIAATGEGYDRSRKCPRDPKTGRLISRAKYEELMREAKENGEDNSTNSDT